MKPTPTPVKIQTIASVASLDVSGPTRATCTPEDRGDLGRAG